MRFLVMACLGFALLLGGLPASQSVQAQNRKRPTANRPVNKNKNSAGKKPAGKKPAGKNSASQKPAGKKPAPPKIALPTVETHHKIRIAPVDEKRLAAVKASAKEIDRLIAKDLAKHNLSPNPDATDEQFLRRIYLGITGTIPTAKQTRLFLYSNTPTKRERLIDQLLNDPGYASHQFNYWADLLRLVDKSDNNTYTRPFGEWLKQNLRNNTPYDKMVHEILAAEGRISDNPAVGYTLRDPGMPLDHLDNTVRIFLGTRIGCAQCHDHPFDHWTQHEFYQLAAFVGGEQTRLPSRLPKNMKASVNLPEPFNQGKFYKEIDAASKQGRAARKVIRLNRSAVWENPNQKLKYPHDYAYKDAKPGDVVPPKVIFGNVPALSKDQSRRQAFAAWTTSPDNPRFTLTIANRMWKQAFGVGLIEPEDDLRDDTKASNPELMEYLVAELKRLNYNLKEFQRVIYNTQAYQREVTYEALKPDEHYHFPGPVLRRMTAEQVWDSLLTLTLEDPDQYLRPSDTTYVAAITVDPKTETAASLIERGQKEQALRADETRDRRKYLYKGQLLGRASELPQPLPDEHFLRQFGQSDRQIIADGNTEGTVPQILTMFNGPVTHMMLEKGSVIYNEVFACKTVEAAAEVIFLSLLNRKPNSRDLALAVGEIRKNKAAGLGNVIWSLLNTREFLFIQ